MLYYYYYYYKSVELWPTFPGSKIFHKGYLAHFLLERSEIWPRQGSGQSKLIPRIS